MKADKQLVEMHTVYTRDGVTYVPHYQNTERYVGPGYPRQTSRTYTSAELLFAGAKSDRMMLWPRANFGSVLNRV